MEKFHHEFVAAMEEGWKTLNYAEGTFFSDKKGRGIGFSHFPRGDLSEIKGACAIGAAAYIMRRDPQDVGMALDCDLRGKLWSMVAEASNNAGSKEAAIIAVKKVLGVA